MKSDEIIDELTKDLDSAEAKILRFKGAIANLKNCKTSHQVQHALNRLVAMLD